jgi:hypothetical protein
MRPSPGKRDMMNGYHMPEQRMADLIVMFVEPVPGVTIP